MSAVCSVLPSTLLRAFSTSLPLVYCPRRSTWNEPGREGKTSSIRLRPHASRIYVFCIRPLFSRDPPNASTFASHAFFYFHLLPPPSFLLSSSVRTFILFHYFTPPLAVCVPIAIVLSFVYHWRDSQGPETVANSWRCHQANWQKLAITGEFFARITIEREKIYYVVHISRLN